MARHLSEKLPERHLHTQCGSMLSGSGVMSFRCSLPMGHAAIPADDPEPHYAAEVQRTVQMWKEWRWRQDNKEPRPFEATAPGLPSVDSVREKIKEIRERDFIGSVEVEVDDEAQPMPNEDLALEEAAGAGPRPTDAVADPIPAPEDTAFNPEAHLPDEPLRTREGDQVLPDGDESVPDDQSLLIADVEARRQVGIQRYGQGHRPFNGRDTLKDWYEEQLDGLVYARSIVRMAEATREDLIHEVGTVLRKISDSGDPQQAQISTMAETIVDRIKGYVAAKVIGNGTGLPDEILHSLIVDGIHEGLHSEGTTWGEVADAIVAAARWESES